MCLLTEKRFAELKFVFIKSDKKNDMWYIGNMVFERYNIRNKNYINIFLILAYVNNDLT